MLHEIAQSPAIDAVSASYITIYPNCELSITSEVGNGKILPGGEIRIPKKGTETIFVEGVGWVIVSDDPDRKQASITTSGKFQYVKHTARIETELDEDGDPLPGRRIPELGNSRVVYTPS